MATRSLHVLRTLADKAFEPEEKPKKTKRKKKDSFFVFVMIVRV